MCSLSDESRSSPLRTYPHHLFSVQSASRACFTYRCWLIEFVPSPPDAGTFNHVWSLSALHGVWCFSFFAVLLSHNLDCRTSVVCYRASLPLIQRGVVQRIASAVTLHVCSAQLRCPSCKGKPANRARTVWVPFPFTPYPLPGAPFFSSVEVPASKHPAAQQENRTANRPSAALAFRCCVAYPVDSAPLSATMSEN